MKNRPLYSIVIPTYNRAQELKRALNSIIRQTYNNYEIIVCDDGSTDHTKEIVAGFDGKTQITYLWQQNWGGPARPRNKGIKQAKGEWICFLDSDDWWYPHKLEVVHKHLKHSDIIYHDLDIYTPKGKKTFFRLRGQPLNKPVFVDLMTRKYMLFNSSVVAKKSIIDEAGGLTEDRSLISVEDYDLWLKISLLTNRFTYIRKTLGAYWKGDSNLTEVSKKQIERLQTFYSKYFPFLSGENKKEAEMLMSYSIGRIWQKMGEEKESFKKFMYSVKSNNIEIKLKSIYCIALNHFICKHFNTNRIKLAK